MISTLIVLICVAEIFVHAGVSLAYARRTGAPGMEWFARWTASVAALLLIALQYDRYKNHFKQRSSDS
jgi:hypothetical protein